MTHLLALLALIGQPVALHTELGTCRGTVVAPGQAVVEGTCSLERGAAVRVGEWEGGLVSARTLDSGRVVVRFVDGGAVNYNSREYGHRRSRPPGVRSSVGRCLMRSRTCDDS